MIPSLEYYKIECSYRNYICSTLQCLRFFCKQSKFKSHMWVNKNSRATTTSDVVAP